MSPFCSFAPTSVVRGVMPKWRMIATYSALNGRLPLAAALAGDLLAVGNPVRRRGGVVRLVIQRHAAELKERALNTVPDRRDGLRQADARPAPIAVGQHEHPQHVHEELAGARDRELGRPREVGLRGFAGPVELR